MWPDTDMRVGFRSECYSLMTRLHYAHFIQNSFYVRNILVQPGPLTAPPHKRSKKTPSFRLIDFGRAMEYGVWKEDFERDPKGKMQWGFIMKEEDDQARKELQIDHLLL